VRFRVAKNGGNPPRRLCPRATRRKNRKHSGADGSSITWSQWRNCLVMTPVIAARGESGKESSPAYSQQRRARRYCYRAAAYNDEATN
jgi:hypothetical protein